VDYPLQYKSPVNDRAVQADATQRQGDIAGEHQGQPARKGLLLDLDDNRGNPEALQARRQRESGDTSAHDQDSRLAGHHWTLASTTRPGNG